MRGRVGKRGKTWHYVVDVGQDEEGKRQQQWEGGFPTRRAAEEALGKLVGDVREGAYVPKSKQTFGAYLEEWLDGSRNRVRPSTLSSYAMNIRVHVTPALGAVPLQAVTETHLDRLYATLIQKGLSARTTRYIHTLVRKALHDAVRRHRIMRNPADLATPPSPTAARAPEMKTWSGEELGRFLESVRGERLHAMWLVLATSGARRGEVLGLRWSDVDLESGRIQIARSAVMVDHKVTFSTPKTEKSRRTISLDPRTMAGLRSHKAGQAEERLAWGRAYSDEGLVFAQENGEPLNPEYVSKKFVKLASVAGLPRVRVHDLRHGWATMALAAGVHPKVVQERLGHSSIMLTLSVYSHTVPAMETDAAQQVASLIFGQ